MAIETVNGIKVVGTVLAAIASSRTPLRRHTKPAAVTASTLVRRLFANSPITSRLAVNLTRASIGIGSTRLSTTWLSTKGWVMSMPVQLKYDHLGPRLRGDDEQGGAPYANFRNEVLGWLS